MSDRSSGPIPGGAAVKRFRAARRVSMIIGLTIAVLAAAVIYVALFRPSAPSGHQNLPSSSGQQTVSRRILTLSPVAQLPVSSAPSSVQFGPLGKIVVTVTANGNISVWSTGNWRELNSFIPVVNGAPVDSGYSAPPTFSPNGKEFSVVGSDSSGNEVAEVWNVATGQATSVPLPPLSSSATPISPSYATLGSKGLVADSYQNGTVGLVTTPATGLPDATISVHRAAPIGYRLSAPTFSPDGRTIAVSDDLGMIHLVDVPGRRLTASLVAEKIYNNESINGMSSLDVDSITFSPDSKRVACGTESGIVRVWDVATGQNVSAFGVNSSASGAAPARPVKTLVFSPDGKTLITADNADNTLAVWDVASGHQIATLNAGTGNVVSAAFTAGGSLLVATTTNSPSDKKVEIWTTRSKLGG